jgi:predicted metal-dependent phosphoesterase TrpH
MKVKLTSTYIMGEKNGKDAKGADKFEPKKIEAGKEIDLEDRRAKSLLDEGKAQPADAASKKYVEDTAQRHLAAIQPKSDNAEDEATGKKGTNAGGTDQGSGNAVKTGK